MSDNNEVVQKVRAAIEDRALYLALLYRSFSKVVPADQAEKLAREAIFEYGRLRGAKDSEAMTPERWVDSHMAKGSGAVFESRIVKGEECCNQEMTYCPLMKAWRELGCSAEEMDLLCDIAMEVDRGRAAYHGLSVDMPKRIGKGDSFCQLVLRKGN
jgi:hypothetical protein